eukprot:Skav213056  [mRNA]  locus=scaffold364:174519:180817:+ [translate_table: standard]
MSKCCGWWFQNQSVEVRRRQKFVEQGVVEMQTLLMASIPSCTSQWGALPPTIFRHIGDFLLEPLAENFSAWHAMAVVRSERRRLQFGLRLRRQSVVLYNSGGHDEGWIGGAAAVDNGILPSWEKDSRVETKDCRNGYES